MKWTLSTPEYSPTQIWRTSKGDFTIHIIESNGVFEVVVKDINRQQAEVLGSFNDFESASASTQSFVSKQPA